MLNMSCAALPYSVFYVLLKDAWFRISDWFKDWILDIQQTSAVATTVHCVLFPFGPMAGCVAMAMDNDHKV